MPLKAFEVWNICKVAAVFVSQKRPLTGMTGHSFFHKDAVVDCRLDVPGVSKHLRVKRYIVELGY